MFDCLSAQNQKIRDPGQFAWLCAAIILFFLNVQVPSAHADTTTDQDAQSILHMLDYLSVDYGGSVWFGKVLNEREYKEQTEFSSQSVKLLARLPAHSRQPALIREAQELDRIVQSKASAELVSTSAQQLRKKIISAYSIPVSPRHAPNFQQATALYKQWCETCHGADGRGDGPEGIVHNPKPSNFHDATRMGKRSVYGLYSTITLGVARTGMPGFAQLSDDDRWSLAFLISNFHNLPKRMEMGRLLWEKRNFQGAAPNLATLATLTANEVGITHGDNTRAVFEYLRAEPHALEITPHATLIFAAEQLDQSLTHYRSGNQAEALRFAIAAYLEGFEPMEIGLANLNSQLRFSIEHEMMTLRQLIYVNAPVDALSVKIEHAKDLLGQADELLRGGKLTILGAFASSFFVLLREGLAAILMLAVVIAFEIRCEQRKVLSYIHAGWGSALLLGIISGGAAIKFLSFSGVGRAITSGVASLIASVMLIYVWFWLHNKTYARPWQKFFSGDNIALKNRTLWALVLISFFAVYRGVFDTVLFYQALWSQTSDIIRTALWSGMFSAVLVLLILGWGLFRFGIKLPLGLFFPGTAMLLAIMAVIFAGQGIASLQGVGIISATPINFISLPLLGVLPTTQTLLSQIAIVWILILCYRIPIWRQRRIMDDNPPAS